MKHNKIKINDKYAPLRTCVACREVKPQMEMLRVVRQTDGTVAVDLNQRLNGRGTYVCNAEDCILKAQKIRGLERGLKCAISKEVYEECMNVKK